jgi:hypothetical protein
MERQLNNGLLNLASNIPGSPLTQERYHQIQLLQHSQTSNNEGDFSEAISTIAKDSNLLKNLTDLLNNNGNSSDSSNTRKSDELDDDSDEPPAKRRVTNESELGSEHIQELAGLLSKAVEANSESSKKSTTNGTEAPKTANESPKAVKPSGPKNPSARLPLGFIPSHLTPGKERSPLPSPPQYSISRNDKDGSKENIKGIRIGVTSNPGLIRPRMDGTKKFASLGFPPLLTGLPVNKREMK